MQRRLLEASLAAAALMHFGAGHASAALLDAPVPENAYITINGYDVAWAAPCSAELPSCGVIDLSYQSQFGWEIMDADLFNELGIDAHDFVVEGGNVDYATGNNYDEVSGAYLRSIVRPPDGDLALAVPYFSTRHYHADWSNGIQNLWDPISDSMYAEALVFRVSAAVQAVPELDPGAATGALALLLGFGLLLSDRRRAGFTA